MAKIKAIFGDKFLSAVSFDGGKAGINYTIESGRMGAAGKDEKLILTLANEGGEIVDWPLNRTNAENLAAILGSDESDDWNGSAINIYRDVTVFAGKQTPCLRARAVRSGSGSGSGSSK